MDEEIMLPQNTFNSSILQIFKCRLKAELQTIRTRHENANAGPKML